MESISLQNLNSLQENTEINMNFSEIISDSNPVPKKNLERWQVLQLLMKEEITLNEKSIQKSYKKNNRKI